MKHGEVLIVYGVPPDQWTNQNVFNLFCVFGNVVRCRTLRQEVRGVSNKPTLRHERGVDGVEGYSLLWMRWLLGVWVGLEARWWWWWLGVVAEGVVRSCAFSPSSAVVFFWPLMQCWCVCVFLLRWQRGAALVQMSDVEYAEACIKYLSGAVVRGRRITIEFSRHAAIEGPVWTAWMCRVDVLVWLFPGSVPPPPPLIDAHVLCRGCYRTALFWTRRRHG